MIDLQCKGRTWLLDKGLNCSVDLCLLDWSLIPIHVQERRGHDIGAVRRRGFGDLVVCADTEHVRRE